MTINDIAKLAGTSKSTVSRVLTNNPNVKTATRERVLDVIHSYQYQPNSLARGLTQGAINVVALLLPDIRNPFYSEATWFIEKELLKHGYHMFLCCTDHEPEKERLFIEMAEQYNFSGILLFSPVNESFLSEYDPSSKCALVILNRYIDNFSGDILTSDNFQAGYIAARHLINLGHKKIAILSGARLYSTHRERHAGFLQALNAYSLSLPPEYDLHTDSLTMEEGISFGERLLSLGEHAPTAVFCTTDLLAMGIMQAYKLHEKQIPEDLSVIGFDNIPFSNLQGISLTTIRQSYDKIATESVSMLLNRISHHTTDTQRLILDCDLIIRNSTGKPKNDC